jgi:hypothetical protein
VKTVEEIVSALETIKRVCEEFNEDCEQCPLRIPADEYTKVSCGIGDVYPRYWKVVRPKPWTAFDWE